MARWKLTAGKATATVSEAAKAAASWSGVTSKWSAEAASSSTARLYTAQAGELVGMNLGDHPVALAGHEYTTGLRVVKGIWPRRIRRSRSVFQ